MTQKNYQPASSDQVAREASQWDSGAIQSKGWVDAPEAIPRSPASTPISLRMPEQMLRILKQFAEREGVGYQVLMKQWLDERIREERERLVGERFDGVGLAEFLATGN